MADKVSINMMKKLIFILALSCIAFHQTGSSKEFKAKPVLLDLMFQDYFENDVVSLRINDVWIANKVRLSSSTAGFTSLNVKISRPNATTLRLNYLGKSKYCLYSRKINLFVVVNGKKNQLNIDWHKGKYIGLNKEEHNKVSLRQQDKLFIYD